MTHTNHTPEAVPPSQGAAAEPTREEDGTEEVLDAARQMLAWCEREGESLSMAVRHCRFTSFDFKRLLAHAAALRQSLASAEATERRFVAEREMLAADVVFLSQDDDGALTLLACVNDLFAPAADAEPIPDDQFWRLHAIWKSHGDAGVTAWAIEQRGQEPWRPLKEPYASRVAEARAALSPSPSEVL